MATTKVNNRIEELVTKISNLNLHVDRTFLHDLIADVYETAMLDAMVVVEGTESETLIRNTTGYTLEGK